MGALSWVLLAARSQSTTFQQYIFFYHNMVLYLDDIGLFLHTTWTVLIYHPGKPVSEMITYSYLSRIVRP